MEQAYDLTQELNLLDPGCCRLYLDEFQDLILELEGGSIHKAVAVHRIFPITAPNYFIVLIDSDGEEIGIIRDVSELCRESRRALATELERDYFTPKIISINAIEERFHILEWDVETDRGSRAFETRSSRDIRSVVGGRIVIRDAEGNRYEIPDYRKFDPISRAIVESRM